MRREPSETPGTDLEGFYRDRIDALESALRNERAASKYYRDAYYRMVEQAPAQASEGKAV